MCAVCPRILLSFIAFSCCWCFSLLICLQTEHMCVSVYNASWHCDNESGINQGITQAFISPSSKQQQRHWRRRHHQNLFLFCCTFAPYSKCFALQMGIAVRKTDFFCKWNVNYLVIYLFIYGWCVTYKYTYNVYLLYVPVAFDLFFLLVFVLHNMFTHIFRMQNILKIDITSLKIIRSDHSTHTIQ